MAETANSDYNNKFFIIIILDIRYTSCIHSRVQLNHHIPTGFWKERGTKSKICTVDIIAPQMQTTE